MTMVPYDTSLIRPLKWQHNNAQRLQSILRQKDGWYNRYHHQFWDNWITTVFDMRTANSFGLTVWCIILGLPPSLFNFAPISNAFAYGPERENYVDSGGNDLPIVWVDTPVFYANNVVVPTGTYVLNATLGTITFNTAPVQNAVLAWKGTVTNAYGSELIVSKPRQFGIGDGVKKVFDIPPPNADDYNKVGANFYGGGAQSVALLTEIRYALMLRYAALVSNGRQEWINYMLRYIFNEDKEWDLTTGKYFYLTDASQAPSPAVPAAPPAQDMYMEYHVGPNLPLSSQFINILNNAEYGIMPSCAGVKYLVVQD